MVGGLAAAAAVQGEEPSPTSISLDGFTQGDDVPASAEPVAGGDIDDDGGLPVLSSKALPAAPVLIDANAVGPDGLTFDDRNAGLLSAAVPASAGGDLVVVPGSSPAPYPGRDVRTVRVEVEAGLEVDGERFAAMVMVTLNDARGWGGDGSMSFAWTDGAADIRVVLASPDKVDAMCAPLNTHGDYSCGRDGHAAINYTRWVRAADDFGDRNLYRQYVINHEVGHLLGYPHVSCGGTGELAPIMQQQSVRVAPCTPNAWPYPA